LFGVGVAAAGLAVGAGAAVWTGGAAGGATTRVGAALGAAGARVGPAVGTAGATAVGDGAAVTVVDEVGAGFSLAGAGLLDSTTGLPLGGLPPVPIKITLREGR
jgi:hypothetical protein